MKGLAASLRSATRPSYVLNGGACPLVNEHARYFGWAGATDLFPLTSGGGVCAGVGLASFPCFGAPVLAPVSGRIASVVHDRPDMQSTILVREGDRVAAGQEIARCGNSGVAGLPHLLLQARDRPGAWSGDARGRTFPLRFTDAVRIRDESVTLGPFVVRRNDIIQPLAVDEGE